MPTISCVLAAMTHFSPVFEYFSNRYGSSNDCSADGRYFVFLVSKQTKISRYQRTEGGLVPNWQPNGYNGLILGLVTVILTNRSGSLYKLSTAIRIVVAFAATILFDKLIYRHCRKEARL